MIGSTPPGETGDYFPTLSLAVKDEGLRRQHGEGRRPASMTGFASPQAFDQDATRDNLAKLVDKITARIHPRDTFILFAVAHGHSVKEQGRF